MTGTETLKKEGGGRWRWVTCHLVTLGRKALASFTNKQKAKQNVFFFSLQGRGPAGPQR